MDSMRCICKDIFAFIGVYEYMDIKAIINFHLYIHKFIVEPCTFINTIFTGRQIHKYVIYTGRFISRSFAAITVLPA